MFYTQVIGSNGRSLGQIAVREDIDRPSSSCSSIMSNESFEPSISEIRRHRNIPLSFSIPTRRPVREPRHAPVSNQAGLRRFLMLKNQRPDTEQRWQQTQSNTTQDWDRVSTVTPTEQPQMQCQEDQRDKSDPLRKSRDGGAHLKYLVRGFLRKFRSEASASGKRKKLSSKESFVPSPKVTFLIDEPENLTCQICQRGPLKMAITAASPAPDMTAILPCGHISCHDCMSIWLSDHNDCPFCRVDLTYAGCSHKVQPRIIAQDTIHTLPKTLTKGGKIGENCFECAEKNLRDQSLESWAILAEKFMSARHKAELYGTDEAVENMRQAQEAFELLPEEDYQMLTRVKHRQW